MALTAKNRLLSMIVNRSEKFEVTSSNSIASVRGTAHFRPTHIRDIRQPPDHFEGDVRTGPEGVVDDYADIRRGLGRRPDKLLEVAFGVGEVKRGRKPG